MQKYDEHDLLLREWIAYYLTYDIYLLIFKVTTYKYVFEKFNTKTLSLCKQ